MRRAKSAYTCLVVMKKIRIFRQSIFRGLGDLSPATFPYNGVKDGCVVMCPRSAYFSYLRLIKLKLMSTKSHTLPSSVFHGKENLIL